ncbi:DMT family transporter (plasmid) [Pseudoalteromonas sp. T1lg65]|uniref:DMT family transporter n=1 Tax=Pseudoalteromonas sp. T1lg65 TaxID=2077101 RepID=UPI003F7AAA38
MTKLIAYGALIFSIPSVSIAPLLIVVSEVDPNATLLHRMLIACILLLAFPITLSTSNRKTVTSVSQIRYLLATSCVLCFLDLLMKSWAVIYAPIANVALLANTAPMFSMLFMYLLGQVSISKSKALSVVTATMGCSLILWERMSLSHGFVGEIMALISAVFYAAYLNINARLTSFLSYKTIMLYNCFVVAILTFPWVLLYSEAIFPTSINGYLILLALAFVTQIMGHNAIIYAQSHLSNEIISFSLYLRPICAALLAWMILEQSLSLYQILGALCIITALLALYMFGNKES